MSSRLKLQEEAHVVDLWQAAAGTCRLRLLSPGIAVRARPGQFVMIRVREGHDPLLRRPLSFHRIDGREGTVDLLFRVAGRGTHLLSQCRAGDRLSLLGPLGNGFRLPRGPVGAVVVAAGGIGIAPLVELIAALLRNPEGPVPASDIRLLYGARTASELLPASYFSDLGIAVHWCTDDGSRGQAGFVPSLLQEVVERDHLKVSDLYACGPLAMQYHVGRWAVERDIPSQLSLESLMACGLGACLGCALPAFHPTDPNADHYVHVCKDGPIFSAGSIRWQKLQQHRLPPPTFPCS